MQNSPIVNTTEPVNLTLTDRLFDALQRAIVEGETAERSRSPPPSSRFFSLWRIR